MSPISDEIEAIKYLSCGDSAVVEHSTHNHTVMGLKPAVGR
jgi:hypothetical protein